MMATPRGGDPATGRAGGTVVAFADFNPDDRYFDTLEVPFGGVALDLGIGPIGMRLEGLSEDQSGTLAERFRPFVRAPVPQAGPPPDLIIRLRKAPVEHFLAPPDGRAEVYRMGRRSAGDRLVIWSYEFAGWIEARSRAALLALVAPQGGLFERGLENFLRVMTARFILDRGGLLLHGSGVVRDGRAYVFFGPSGSGKTTVTHLSPDDLILSDDLTLIVLHDGAYRAAGIPFGMAHHCTPQSEGSFPIASLNRLVQSDKVSLERIEGARALAELSGSLPFVMQEPAEAARALDTAQQVVDKVPVRRLKFRRDASFWQAVETG
jgi:hypothetical protein